eukprot:2440219-Rhodomonas_salina.2
MMGIVAILDPPRPEAISAIKIAHEAGIVVKMITGDHPETAIAIGKMLGIIDPMAAHAKAYTGPELDAMSEQGLLAGGLQSALLGWFAAPRYPGPDWRLALPGARGDRARLQHLRARLAREQDQHRQSTQGQGRGRSYAVIAMPCLHPDHVVCKGLMMAASADRAAWC